jgi:hypothetical protein
MAGGVAQLAKYLPSKQGPEFNPPVDQPPEKRLYSISTLNY